MGFLIIFMLLLTIQASFSHQPLAVGNHVNPHAFSVFSLSLFTGPITALTLSNVGLHSITAYIN